MLSVAKGESTDAWSDVSAALGDGEEVGTGPEGMAPTVAPGSCRDLQLSGMGAVECTCPGVS